MHFKLKYYINVLLTILLLFIGLISSYASHMIGGEINYVYLGNDKYRITFTIYQDCLTGQPSAIQQDNPLYYAIYQNSGSATTLFKEGNLSTSNISIVPPNFQNDCIFNFPTTCLRKQVQSIEVVLPNQSSSYTISYQRCCRNASIMNLYIPGNIGVTYTTTIPKLFNNSNPRFNNDPPQIICANNPFSYDFSATDIDGDSLSYELCSAYIGGLPNNPIPGLNGEDPASPPPYTPVTYIPPYSYQVPIIGTPSLTINKKTGILSGKPNQSGRFIVTICVSEWKNGYKINTTNRDLQFVITDCSKAVVADIPSFVPDNPEIYIIECKSFDVKFLNNSVGGFNYLWDFGIAGATSTEFEPTFTYPDTGTYTIKLVVNPGTTCSDSITKIVKVYPYFITNFEFDGLFCPDEEFTFKNTSIFEDYSENTTLWKFGNDSTSSEFTNLKIKLKAGDNFVSLEMSNQFGCVDKSKQNIYIAPFVPFAGNDTVIVKNYPFRMGGSGGLFYKWTPNDYLETDFDPRTKAFFTDTGKFTYILDVESETGCMGKDTVNITVINNSIFVVPNAFTPNADGLNDRIKPIMYGYSNLVYFKIFNRFGALVYESTGNGDKGWDGLYKGQPSDAGVYFWVVSAVDPFGKEIREKGDITLLR